MIAKVLMIVALLVLARSSFCGVDAWESMSLISGKPTSVKELSSSDGSEQMLGSLFEVRLKNVENIRGKKQDKKITVRLTASHKESLSSEGKIFVLLDLKSGKPEALYWTISSSVVCIPETIVSDNNLSNAFFLYDKKSKRTCTNAEWF